MNGYSGHVIMIYDFCLQQFWVFSIFDEVYRVFFFLTEGKNSMKLEFS